MRRSKTSTLVLFILIESALSQKIENRLQPEAGLSDRVRNALARLERFRSPEQITDEDRLYVGKCGFRLSFELMRVWQYLNQQERDRAEALLKPTEMQKDTVIGRFRIHYDTTGIHEPALLDTAHRRIPGTARAYVDSVGRIFNDVWSYEITTLGYIEPPHQTGDSYFNVYIENLGSNLYGQTRFLDQINPGQIPPRYTAYVRVHHDFAPFYSKGMDGLKVTAAHEFHHVVQVGSYGFWREDLYFYEITSTWMEDVVYDDVNDYYQYIRSPSGAPPGQFAPLGHFATPYRSLNVTGNLIEYSRAIWGKFIQKRFDPSVLRRAWEFMQQTTSLPSLDQALNERGSTLREAYEEFAIWNFFTGSRADSINYYSEATQYPDMRLQDTLQFRPPLTTLSPTRGLESLGSSYLMVYLDLQQTRAVFPIVVKGNIVEAGNGMSERFQLIVRNDGGDESYLRFSVGNNTYWAKLSGINNPLDWSLFQSGAKLVPSAVLVYPNPFYAGSQSWVRFEVPTDNVLSGNIYIYNSSMELVYSKNEVLTTSPFRSRYFTWYGDSNSGERASTGVYIYVIELDDQQYTGKFSLIRK